MNKCFKVIWSKTRNCYVVVSEIARRNNKSSKVGLKRSAAALAMVGLLSIGGTNVALAADPATGSYDPATNTDTLTNQLISRTRADAAKGDLKSYDHPDRNLVINWTNNSRGDGSAIRAADVNAKNITINADFNGNHWTDKGVISDGNENTNITASGTIKITTNDDSVYTQDNGKATIDGFKNLIITPFEKGFGLVDNGGGITVTGGSGSTVTIETKIGGRPAIGNGLAARSSKSSDGLGKGITITADTIRIQSASTGYYSLFNPNFEYLDKIIPYFEDLYKIIPDFANRILGSEKAISAGQGINGKFTVDLNAATTDIIGTISGVGGDIFINPDTDGTVTLSAADTTGKSIKTGNCIELSSGSNLTINKNSKGLVQITGKMQVEGAGSSVFANMTGDGSFVDADGDAIETDNGGAVTLNMSGKNSYIHGNMNSGNEANDGGTITINATGDNDKVEGNVHAANDGTITLNMSGKDSSIQGDMVSKNKGNIIVKALGENDKLIGKATNNGTMNLTFANQSAMIGNLTSTAGSAQVSLQDGSHWTGNLDDQAKEGSAHIVLQSGSDWTGTAKGQGDISLSGGSLWKLTGDSEANEVKLDKGSTISMEGPATKLEINNLGGTGGQFQMDLRYGNDDVESYRDGNSSDFVLAHGGVGSTYTIAMTSNSSVNGMKDGSKLYFASTAPGTSSFQLNQAVQLQNYNKIYNKNLVVKKETDTANSDYKGYDDWFLTPDSQSGDNGNIINPNGTVPGSAYNAAFAIWRSDDTLLKRLGELRYNQEDQGVWARFINKRLERDGRHSFHGNYKTLQVGLDKERATIHNGTWYYGGAISHLWGNTDYANGHGSQKSTDLSFYTTNIRPHGHYLDLIARLGRIDSDYDTAYGDHGKFENWASSIGAEYGRKETLNHGWTIEPQVQMTYNYLWGDDYTTRNGSSVQQDNADSLVGRLGFVLSREFQQQTKNPGQVYMKASVLHDFLGNTGNRIMDDVTFADNDDLGDTWYLVGLGTNIHFSDNAQFYFDAERSFSADVNMKYRFNAGLRFEF